MIIFQRRFEFQTKYLVVIAVLAIAFSCAFIMRFYPAKYGFYLNEFDPYFNYRATRYIVDHGLDAYWKWHDTMSWYPEGRDIVTSSQSGLHIVAAFLYSVFGRGGSLLDFTILLPVVIGSLTTIIVFALARLIDNTRTGMFAALLFAFSPFIIQRGNLGWFKSEPLGLFFGLLALYLLISAIKKHKEVRYYYVIPKAVIAGLVLGLANASWGGAQYFNIPLSLFFIALPFFRKDTKILLYITYAFTLSTLISTAVFPRPGISFVFGLPGISLIGATVFLTHAHFLKKLSNPVRETRNTLFLLISFFIVGLGAFIGGSYYYTSDFRYLNAINPFSSLQNPLTESVSEHSIPTLVDYFTDFSIFLMLAGFGVWIAFKRLDDMSVFALIFALTGVYASSMLVRLLVFASAGIIILAAIGLSEITRSVMQNDKKESPVLKLAKDTSTTSNNVTKINKRINFYSRLTTYWDSQATFRVTYGVLICFILIFPMVYPSNFNWLTFADIPPTILSGHTSRDWIDALNWISKNTPENAVIASWWDYGYWITTLGNRTTLADNGTFNQTRIITVAKMFMDTPEDGIKLALNLKADYILIYLTVQRISINGTPFYILGDSGDESKLRWFVRIGGFDERSYLKPDQFTPTQKFWNTTLIGRLIPLVPYNDYYTSFENGELTHSVFRGYEPGALAVYTKYFKYPENYTNKDHYITSTRLPAQTPLTLVYKSDSFDSNEEKIASGVLIYKVNHNYNSTKQKTHRIFTSIQ